MLKNSITNFFKSPVGVATNTSLKTITETPAFAFSTKKKSRGKKIRDYIRKGYTRVSKLKRFDFRQEDLTFPVNIKMKVNYIYKPKKKILPKQSREDYIIFKKMTGNEILLNLENSRYLSD